MKLFKKFREYLLKNTQINAVYYGKRILNEVKVSSYNLELSLHK